MPNYPSIVRSPQPQQVDSSFKFETVEDERLHAWVNGEVDDMIDWARPARQDGKEAIEGYMAVAAKARTAGNNRSDLLFPLVHSIIYARCAVEAASSPGVKFTAQHEEDEPKMKYIEAIIKQSEQGDGDLQPPVDHVFFEQTFDKNLLGVGATYVGYNFQTRKTHVRDEHGNWVERTMVVQDDIVEMNVDFFNFGVTRGTKQGMYGGKACYWDVFYPRAAFFDKFGDNPFYFNVEEHKIPTGDWFGGNVETKYPVPHGYVRVRYFWDIIEDLFYVQANGVPIRHDYILDYGNPARPKKYLPITTIHNDYSYEYQKPARTFTQQGGRYYTPESQVGTNKTFWSKGDAKLCKPMIAAKNTFGRAYIDYLKAASVHFVVGPTGIIDRINAGKLYGIQTIKMDAGDFNTKSLVQGSNFSNEFKGGDEMFSEVMTFALGRDWRRAAMDPATKPTLAAMQQEVERRRDQQNSRMNETGGIVRKYWIKYNLTQQYIPEPSQIPVVGSNGMLKGVEEADIVRNADAQPIAILNRKKIKMDMPMAEIKLTSKIKIKNDKGEDIEEERTKYTLVAPDHPKAKKQKANASNSITARGDYIVTKQEPNMHVIPLSSYQKDDALKKAVFTEQLQALAPFMTMLANGQPVIPASGVNYLVEEAAGRYGMDADKLTGKDKSADEEENEIAPPAFADAQEKMNPQVPPAMAGNAPVVQTAAQGSPAAPGSALGAGGGGLAKSLSL